MSTRSVNGVSKVNNLEFVMDKTYNGWSNYETWTVNLWIGGTEGGTNYWDAQAKEVLEDNDNNVEEATEILANMLKEDMSQHECTNLHAELLDDALSKVDWKEISAFFIEASTP
jgi:hypothetical protein